MARPKAFDIEKALGVAQMVFWQKGYAATSTDDLRLAMGIGRQSFYDTFTGKHELYLDVLNRYTQNQYARYSEALQKAKTPLAGIRNFMLLFLTEDENLFSLGCLGVSAICEFGTSNAAVKALSEHSAARLHALMVKTLHTAKRQDQIKASCNADAAAKLILTTLSGMKVAAKGGSSKEELIEIADALIDSLKP